MNKEVFAFLRSYSFHPKRVNRLLVSAFLDSFNIKKTRNSLLNSLRINEKDDDYLSLQEFLKIHRFSKLEELIEVFEFVVSPKDKIVTGAVYTPRKIRDHILTECFSKLTDYRNLKICDPACGCAGFLYSAAKAIKNKTGLNYATIFREIIYGLDIEEFAVTRSKILLTLLAVTEGEEKKEFRFNLFQGNALNFRWDTVIANFEGFNVIVGNPPYVCSRNISEESKKLMTEWKVSSSGHPDLYIPFFQIGVDNLKSNGILGFITMNTFFKSLNGRSLRQYFEDEALFLRIYDFGSNQVFKSKSTYTCICLIQKGNFDRIEYAKGDGNFIPNKIKYNSIHYKRLNHKTGWNLQNADFLNKIENKGIPFGELYKTRTGIATLKNNVYIFKPVSEDKEFYYLQNTKVCPIEKGICKEIINSNKLTQIDNIDQLRQKVIFPYEYNEKGDAVLMSEEKLQFLFPQAYAYLKSKKSVLATRDKGNGKYLNWYAYGRNQSLEKYSNKLLFPHLTKSIPNFTISSDENLLFYNGLAVVSDDNFELEFLRKIMSSELFWYYIVNSSKPYGSGYFSMSRNYIKNFGMYEFSQQEKRAIIESDTKSLNEFLEDRYEIGWK